MPRGTVDRGGMTEPAEATRPGAPRSAAIPAVVLAPGADDPAAFAPCWADLLGRPVVAWAVDVLEAAPEIGALALAVPPQRAAAARRLARTAGWTKVWTVAAPAGSDPAEQTRAALDHLPPSDRVLLHDGARPLLAPATLAALLAVVPANTKHPALTLALAAVPARETMKWVDAAGDVRGTPPRATLWQPQYPAVCPRAVLDDALRGPHASAIAARAATAGLAWLLDACAECTIRLVRAPDDDLPVRAPEDLAVVGAILRPRHTGR